MRRIRWVVVSFLLAGAIAACERVVDLTPPDSSTAVPDAAISSFDDANLSDAAVGGADGNDAVPPDASPDAF